MEYEALTRTFWDTGTFWVTFAVLIFLFFFGRKIVGAINVMLDQRSAAIQRELDEAARLRTEAESMLKDAEDRRRAAQVQAQDMLAMASREAERLAAELLVEAQASARRREQMAQERIAAAESAAVAEVRNVAAALAAQAAEHILKDTIDGAHDQTLIDQAIIGLPAALKQKVA